MNLELSYILAKQVPAMERGFTISTSYGDIVIEAGALADRLSRCVKQALEGECLEHHAVGLSLDEAKLISSALMASHSALSERLQALRDDLSSFAPAVLQTSAADPSQGFVAAQALWMQADERAPHRHSSELSAPSKGLVIQPSADPANPAVVSDQTSLTPKVD